MNHRVLAVSGACPQLTYDNAKRKLSIPDLLEQVHFPPEYMSGPVVDDPNAAVAFLQLIVRLDLRRILTTKIDQGPVSRVSFIQGLARCRRVARSDGGPQPDLFFLSAIPGADTIAQALFETRGRFLGLRGGLTGSIPIRRILFFFQSSGLGLPPCSIGSNT